VTNKGACIVPLALATGADATENIITEALAVQKPNGRYRWVAGTAEQKTVPPPSRGTDTKFAVTQAIRHRLKG
jgi:hypothetical protein